MQRRFLAGSNDDFCGCWIVNEVVAGIGFAKLGEAGSGIFKALNGLNPNRPVVRKLSKDVVGGFHVSPKAAYTLRDPERRKRRCNSGSNPSGSLEL